MKLFFCVLSFFAGIQNVEAQISHAPPRPVTLTCRGNELINQNNGQVIRRFTFDSDCQDALSSRRGDLLCADNGIHSDLMNVWGDVLKTLTWESDCKKAIDSRRGRLLCVADGIRYQLMTTRGEVLETYTWESDCLKGLNGAFEEFACKTNGNKYDLINQYIRRTIATFTFSSHCEDAKKQAPSGYLCIEQGLNYDLITNHGYKLQTFRFESDCQVARQDRIDNPPRP